MKRQFLFYFLGAILLIASCKKSSIVQNKYIPINQCLQKKFGMDQVSLCFDSLLQDSRCPTNVMCIWSGYALVKFTFNEGGQHHPVRLSTLRMMNFPSPDTTISGYTIRLINVFPYPGEVSSPVRVEVELTK